MRHYLNTTPENEEDISYCNFSLAECNETSHPLLGPGYRSCDLSGGQLF